MSTSTWKSAATKRRTIRASLPPDVPATKNRRQWCRGKIGTAHLLVCRNYREVKGYSLGFMGDLFSNWRLLVCTTCGKELALYAPSGWDAEKQTPPAWVDS